MSVYMYLKINALGDYKKKYDPFARLLALKRGVGVCSVVGVVSGFHGIGINGRSHKPASCNLVPAQFGKILLGIKSAFYCTTC